MEPHALDRLVEKGFRRFRISPRGEAEVDHLTVRVNRAPEVAPLAACTNVGLVNMPVQAAPGFVFERSLCDFRTELSNPSVGRRCIHFNATLCQQIPHIPARKREPAIPAHRAQDHVRRKPMMFERTGFHDGSPSSGHVSQSAAENRLTQQTPAK